jgi:hypothetical protein
MYGGMCTGEYARSLMHVPIAMNANGVDVSFAFIFNNSLIQSARNQLADIFVKHDFTHMMFIDADIKFNAGDILTMMRADKDVLAGIYPKKEINWGMVHNAVGWGEPPEKLTHYTGSLVVNLLNNEDSTTAKVTEPVEVFGAGTGFMLIKKSVFEKLSSVVDTYVDDDGVTKGEFFFLKKDPSTGRQMSEDYAFCALCREHDIKVHVAPWVRLGHVGTYLFEGSVIPVTSKE